MLSILKDIFIIYFLIIDSFLFGWKACTFKSLLSNELGVQGKTTNLVVMYNAIYYMLKHKLIVNNFKLTK